MKSGVVRQVQHAWQPCAVDELPTRKEETRKGRRRHGRGLDAEGFYVPAGMEQPV